MLRVSLAVFREHVEALRTRTAKQHLKALLFTSSEIFIIFVLIGRGLEIVYLKEPREPLLRALHDIGHLPVKVHGTLLLTLCFTHLLALQYKKWRVRAVALFLETMFFLFHWFVMVFVGEPFLGITVLPIIALFCFGNLINCVLWERVK